MIRVLIVDDHPAVRTGTKAILETAGMEVTILKNIDEIIQAASNPTFDIFLVDLYMPDINGLELSKRILQVNPEAKIVIYTGFDINTHFDLLINAGIAGFVSKMSSSEQLVNAIYCALNEEVIIPLSLLRQLRRNSISSNNNFEENSIITLSNKEQNILELISKGYTNKMIAEELYVSQRTIEYSLTKIFSKLKANSRIEALQIAQKYGLISNLFIPDS
ncbi:response regulator transcription factor [Lysinibacillus sphaericus]|uniref:Competence protein A n=3 Tax=Lysinibacillus TaxID=400634 RepID=A0A2S0K0J3_LYSSH|nr:MULTISPECIES: response regulator transcription factor [Lysinibacillus]AHN21900.1 LuxR family transcriptional regulator [Lysinibacillus varians]AVK96912.1 DNA-binding response regulator [Lysinibacillus sphaericus]MCS1381535.1 response regulator transcription factor [Lysinibacillus sphaericus]MED4542186.1 response regulator transcription factor [Lysinibacillus sphaericus]TKI20523.1 response regulator transcription factor [Lysinibacillus sphaericus]